MKKMKYCKQTLILLFILHFAFINQIQAQTIRIMPMGNSITYDENSGDVPGHERPVGDRISYRYKLYQLLTSAGYNFDFTGSEDAGNNYFQNAEMDDCAGFPGITDYQMAVLLHTGYNQRTGIQVSPGPYLQTYPTDIILLHIGTNDLDESSDDVEDILYYIRNYAPNAFILVARIINRETYSALTTTFNDNVEAYVAELNDPRIISVNMETGAGINYSTDMYDNLHPDQNGYNKMAAKWFEAINNLNKKPVIDVIPNQTTNEGNIFNSVSLDEYIADPDDADNKIVWTILNQSGSNLSISIDANRILHATPVDENWNGNETIRLKAEDSGNGTFKKSDTVEIKFIVTPVNDVPEITSNPLEAIDEDSEYSYTIIANDKDQGNVLTFSAIQIPDWLTFNSNTRILSGTPLNEQVGVHHIILRVSDGNATVDQSFDLTVNNTNDPPVITSAPAMVVNSDQTYNYILTASDPDVGDVLTFSAIIKPSWLMFTSDANKGILSSQTNPLESGAFPITLQVSDGDTDILQEYSLTVNFVNALQTASTDIVQLVYPNPASDRVFFQLDLAARTRISIFDVTGKMQKQIETKSEKTVEMNLSDLPNGLYIYNVFQNNIMSWGKIIKNH